MLTFAEHSHFNEDCWPSDDTQDIDESFVIRPGVAKAAAVGILLNMKSLSGQIRQSKGPETMALSALSTQVVLLGSMIALLIGTIDSDAATGTRR